MPVVIGIDPGLARTGFGVIQAEGLGAASSVRLLDVGCIETPAGMPLSDRLTMLADDLRTLLDGHAPDAIAVEELYFAKNVTTGLSVAHARGIVLLEASRRNLSVASYAPARVKQAVTSSGAASKQQVQEMVRMLLRLEAVPQPDDAADALAIALCHTYSEGIRN